MRNVQLSRLAITATIMVLASPVTRAGTATDTMAVSATISNNCTISAAALGFGAYDPIVTHKSTDATATTTVTVTCTKDAAATLTFDNGANYDSTNSTRRLAASLNYLNYGLYEDSGHTTAWDGVAHTGTGTSTDITVYGKIPANQNVAAGSYTDTVTATITF